MRSSSMPCECRRSSGARIPALPLAATSCHEARGCVAKNPTLSIADACGIDLPPRRLQPRPARVATLLDFVKADRIPPTQTHSRRHLHAAPFLPETSAPPDDKENPGNNCRAKYSHRWKSWHAQAWVEIIERGIFQLCWTQTLPANCGGNRRIPLAPSRRTLFRVNFQQQLCPTSEGLSQRPLPRLGKRSNLPKQLLRNLYLCFCHAGNIPSHRIDVNVRNYAGKMLANCA